MDGRLRTRPNQVLFSLALTRIEISSRPPEAATLTPLTVAVNAPPLVQRKGLADKLRFHHAGDFREGNVDRHADIDVTPLHLRNQFQSVPEMDNWVGFLAHDAGLGLDAERERDRRSVDAGLRRERPSRTYFQPKIWHAGRNRAERDRTAHLGPFLPRRLFDEGTIAPSATAMTRPAR